MLTDDIIMEKRNCFAVHINDNEGDLNNQSTCWLADFKQKNGIQGTPSRL